MHDFWSSTYKRNQTSLFILTAVTTMQPAAVAPNTHNHAGIHELQLINIVTSIILIVTLPCILISTKFFLPTNALFIKNVKCYSLYLKYLFIWLLHVLVPLDHHQGACSGTLLKLQLL